MIKRLFGSVKVIYDAHARSYDVYYRKWFIWRLDRQYKHDYDDWKIHYCTKDEAKKRAIERADSLLDTVEVYRKTNYIYYF
jgi:hypothetical protein